MTAEDLWKVIAKLGAKEKDQFLRYAREALEYRELMIYRFDGNLGPGGKLHLDMDGRARVSCYSGDETPERLAAIAKANRALERLSGR